MSQVKISGNASGTGVFTVASPNSNNTQTLTLPDATATLVGDTSTQTLTNKTLTTPTIATIKSAASATPTVFQDSAGTEVGQLCRAWVNFNGVTTASIRVSFNVSSVTRNGTGDYTVNFTNAMPDVNYAVVWSVGNGATGNYYALSAANQVPTASACRVNAGTTANANIDVGYGYVAIFR